MVMKKKTRTKIVDRAAKIIHTVDENAKIIQSDKGDIRTIFCTYIDSKTRPLTTAFFEEMNKICKDYNISYGVTIWDLTAVTIYYKIIMYNF